MLSAITIAAVAPVAAAHGFGFFPILPIVLTVVVIALIARGASRRRHFMMARMAGVGPFGQGGFEPFAASRSAEATLTDRFANGDLDAVEYQARLTVLRANAPAVPEFGHRRRGPHSGK